MKRSGKLITVVLITLMLVLSGSWPALALDDADVRTVRVGFYHTVGYHEMDEKGSRSGYGYDVLQAMKLYNNWKYEYVGYDKGWNDIQQMILDGDIDLVVSANKTPARMEIYDFSDRPVGQSGACLMVKAGESPYVAGRYESYNGMRIGFIENSSQIASTEAFAQEKGFTFTPVYYKTSDELESAILAGDIDALVTSNLRILADTRRLELFAMQDIHAIVQKGNKELLAEVNYALEQISLYNPNLFDSLYNKYYSIDSGDKVFFSPDESQFINQCQDEGVVLRASLPPDISPYAYFDGDEPTGILYDIASEILRRTGLEFEVIVTKTDAEYLALIENQGVDLRMAARFDYNYAEKLGYTLIDPYYQTEVSRVTRKDMDHAARTVAVVKNSQIEAHYLPTILTDETVFYFDTMAECVQAVLDGSCDALYTFNRSAQEAVYGDETNRLTSVIMPRYSFGFTIGIREGADSRLASILEKAADSLSDEDTSALVLKYTDYPQRPATLRSLIYNNPLLILFVVALLLILVFAVIMLSLAIRRRRFEREKNIQLQEALVMAEQANSAKSVFMSRMSHEIRTPLNAIIGYNSISNNKLSLAKTEPEYRQAAMSVLDCLSKSDIASRHLLSVINDVLDMSAIESGRIKLNHESFDFKNMISSLTVMYYSSAKSKGVNFEVVFNTPVEEWFIGDQMRINQILNNLLSNAIKFTPSGGHVRMYISQTPVGDKVAQITFEIEDNGIGMEKSFMENIWTPFEQADASISRRFGGTGLGLSITKNLVDLMGGVVCVESQVGKGTTFIVDLNLERMEQPAPGEIYDFSGISVLVADDDRSACDYLKLLLDRFGVQSTTVTSGKEAVDLVSAGMEKDNPFNICLIDWYMPEMDGLATVKKIREIAGPDLPIIVISAYDFADIEEPARAAGVNSFAAKPLFQSTVFDLLANISGKRSADAAPRKKAPDFAGAHILLVEDNKMNMEIAKALLVSWNLQVDEAADGKEAVEIFTSSPEGTYKVILMDVHMPEMDGYTATQTIRASAHPEAATVPIIAMTADVFVEDVAEAMAAGMNAHVGKPIEKTLLLEALRRFIS